MLLSAEQAATKIAAIVDTRKPRFKYDLAVDAKVVDGCSPGSCRSQPESG